MWKLVFVVAFFVAADAFTVVSRYCPKPPARRCSQYAHKECYSDTDCIDRRPKKHCCPTACEGSECMAVGPQRNPEREREPEANPEAAPEARPEAAPEARPNSEADPSEPHVSPRCPEITQTECYVPDIQRCSCTTKPCSNGQICCKTECGGTDCQDPPRNHRRGN